MAPAKLDRRRLTGKTPALTAGCYAGESASDMARTSYWCQFVSHDPVYFLGAESVFEEYDAKEQARREAIRDREMREFANPRKPKPSDYFYTGDEIVPGHSARLSGKPYSSIFTDCCPSHLEGLVTRYERGSLRDPVKIDLARYIKQEHEACRYSLEGLPRAYLIETESLLDRELT